jgi:hypothetical protein
MAKSKLDLRAEDEIIARVERLAAALSRPGAEVSRSAAARAALLRGLDVLEAEAGIAKPAQKGGKKAPRKA